MLMHKALDGTLVGTFDSVEEYADYTSKYFDKAGRSYTEADSFTGGVNATDCVRYATQGKDDMVADFGGLSDFVLDMATTFRAKMRSVHGQDVNIGQYLSGQPNCARIRVRRTSTENPVKIVVNTTLSAAISQKQILARGKCVVALLQAVQISRPVDLWLCSEAGRPNVTALVRVQSRPFSLAQVAFAIAHPAYFRILGHISYQGLVGRITGQWHSDFDGTNHDSYAASIRSRLDLAETDAYFGPLHYEDKMKDNPQAWIQREYRRIMGLTESVTDNEFF